MTNVLELAASLGKAIAESPQAMKLRAARQALRAEPDLTKTLEEYGQQAEKIARLEDENKPIEVEDKHRLQAFSDKLVSSDVFKKYTAAQVDYVDLMRKVNEELRKKLSETEND